MASARGVRGAARIDSARRKVPMDCRIKETFILKLDTKKEQLKLVKRDGG
jgi:hypothetical protein